MGAIISNNTTKDGQVFKRERLTEGQLLFKEMPYLCFK